MYVHVCRSISAKIALVEEQIQNVEKKFRLARVRSKVLQISKSGKCCERKKSSCERKKKCF